MEGPKCLETPTECMSSHKLASKQRVYVHNRMVGAWLYIIERSGLVLVIMLASQRNEADT